ncbi:MAG: restriction endonuclease subunit S, partial [Prevotella sp.]|nr:restriction endonuclease subunit S [Prevotella sp.]
MDRTKWEQKRIEEVCDKASSNIVLNKIEDNVGDYPLYGASGYVKSVDFFHMEQPYVGIVKDGAGVGRVGIYPAKSSLVGTMQYIIPKKGCMLQYLSYGLQSLHLDKHVSGATIPHIYFKNYGKDTIPFPPLSDQRAIVAELDKLNEVIALKRKQLADLDSLAQSLFYEMFGDPVVNEK